MQPLRHVPGWLHLAGVAHRRRVNHRRELLNVVLPPPPPPPSAKNGDYFLRKVVQIRGTRAQCPSAPVQGFPSSQSRIFRGSLVNSNGFLPLCLHVPCGFGVQYNFVTDFSR
jgi:hypothetical protein